MYRRVRPSELEKDEPVYIFGTGTVGMLSLEAMRLLGREPAGFIVSRRDTTWKDIDGIAISEMSECGEDEKRSTVLIALLPEKQAGIKKLLSDAGYERIVLLQGSQAGA